MKKICITGGHLAPALALIEEIRASHTDWSIICIGRARSFEGNRILSEEARVMEQMGVLFYPIVTGRLTRRFSVFTFISLVKVPFGFFQSVIYCFKHRPSIIVSFGGYVAVPVVFAGRLLGIPAVTHEQTQTLGFANRLIQPFVQRTYLGVRTRSEILSPRTKYIGALFRPSLFLPRTRPLIIAPTNKPILYIMGGTEGSVAVNEAIYPIIPALTKQFYIIHQTGQYSFKRAHTMHMFLEKTAREGYLPIAYLDMPLHAWVLRHARLVVSRAGANTINELIVFSVVAILIPLPWSGAGEQHQNALPMELSGSGRILDQSILSPASLLGEIAIVNNKRTEMSKYAKILSKTIPVDGVCRMVEDIHHLLSP